MAGQSADADQSRHPEGPDGRVDVEPEFGECRRQRVHAARARRRLVHVELRRDDPGTRRKNRHPALAIRAPAAVRLPDAAGLLPDQAKPRHRRQQADRADDRHACHRAGRQDRHEVVGCRHRRRQEPAHLQQRPARQQGQGARRRRQLLARTRESPRRTSLVETPGTTCPTRSAAVAPSGCVADDCGMRVRMSQANSSVCRSNARNRAGVSPIFLLQVSIIGR